MKASIHGAIELLYNHLFGGTEEYHEKHQYINSQLYSIILVLYNDYMYVET
jgi:hypothetical protein